MECSSHGKPLETYCDSCDKVICQLCTINQHRDHKCDAITDAFPRHQQQIVDSLEQVKKKLAAITTAVQAVETQEEGFLEQVGAVRREIEATVQQLMQLLQESERQLMRELDQVTDAYMEKISARKKEADITITQLKSCIEFAEEELRIGSQQEILVMKGQMVERMAAVCSLDNLQPLEETRVRFVKSTSVLEACRSLGSVVRYGQLKTTDDKTGFDLCSASEQVSCRPPPVADSTECVRCLVRQVTPGSFEVCYPPTAGPHQLKVQVGGTDILVMPLNVEIMPRKAGRAFTDLSSTRGLAITRYGQLIVAERDKHCIIIFDPANGRKIGGFGPQLGNGREQFYSPQGMAVTQNGSIVVADYDSNRLQVLTAEGALIATVGKIKGSKPLQFWCPRDVAVHHNGQIFVSEYGNNRVQVLNADLTYSHCFSVYGAQPGEFNSLYGIAIDNDGMVYVADSKNNRVQKFTPEGKLLDIFDNKREEGGELNQPSGLCVDANGILYVTECNGSNTVRMFSSNGKFLGYIGDKYGSSFKNPRFITSDKAGRLYISGDNGVVTYTY